MTADEKAILDAGNMARQYLDLRHESLSVLVDQDDRDRWHERLGLLIDAYHELLVGHVRRPSDVEGA